MRSGLRTGWIFIIAGLCMAAWAGAEQGSPETVDELIRAALQADVDVERGAAVYRQACADCHGAQAHGDPARGAPALAHQRQAYLIKRLADIDQRECLSAPMQRVLPNRLVSEPKDWADLAAYLNGLSPAAVVEQGPGQNLELGEGIFQAQCASCHEADGGGDEDGFTPSLRHQHYSYLVRETRRMAQWHRYNVEQDLSRFLSSLADDEIVGVAGYLARSKAPLRDRAQMREDGRVGD